MTNDFNPVQETVMNTSPLNKGKKIQSSITTTITKFTDGTEATSVRENYIGQTLTEIDLYMSKRSKELGYPVKYVDVYRAYTPNKGLSANITFETGSYYEEEYFDV